MGVLKEEEINDGSLENNHAKTKDGFARRDGWNNTLSR